MRAHYTVDAIAEVILTQLQAGAVDSKTLRRFYKRGKRDAKRHSFKPSRDLVIHAIGLATSKICERYLDARNDAVGELGTLATDSEKAARLLDQLEMAANVVVEEQGVQLQPTDLSQSPTVGALTQLKATRHATLLREAQARAAALGQESAAAVDRLDALSARYLQLAVSCREVGGLIWARYCMGYERGKQRRVSPDDGLEGPPLDVEFPQPCHFEGYRPFEAIGRDR